MAAVSLPGPTWEKPGKGLGSCIVRDHPAPRPPAPPGPYGRSQLSQKLPSFHPVGLRSAGAPPPSPPDWWSSPDFSLLFPVAPQWPLSAPVLTVTSSTPEEGPVQVGIVTLRPPWGAGF